MFGFIKIRQIFHIMKILCIGDIFGKPGRAVIRDHLPELKKKYKVDFVVANAENLAHGKGVTSTTVAEMRDAGIDFFTSGNHIWEPKKRDVLIDLAGYVLRPINYPKGNIGIGSNIFKVGLEKIGVINAQGLAFM